ncbi:amidohydrolase family protein, partial [Candidatus Bathyarchaeota archaeon]|nr:amidohydrolase family protein [Candidatus Bathyarchaeota archaeon]NIV44069.1 amidohydrolase family protein [Candidatus Bathyarchaeota archaeon]
RMLDEAATIAQRFQGSASGRINIRLGPHTVYTCSPELLKEVRKVASKLKIGLHIHLAESMSMKEAVKANFGLTETELLEEIDFLDSDVLVAHCIHLS